MRWNSLQTAKSQRHASKVRALLATVLVSTSACAEPANSNADVGTVWWNELVTANPDRSKDFYAHVIGWTPKTVAAEDNSRPPALGEPEYTLFMQNNSESAGIAKFESTEPNAPKPGWLTYIQVVDVDTAVTEALRLGGRVLKAPYDAKSSGRLAVIEDLDGNSVGLFAAAPAAAAKAAAPATP